MTTKHKLTPEVVERMREAYVSPGDSIESLARYYGVTPKTAADAIHGRGAYNHPNYLPVPAEVKYRGTRGRPRALTPETIEAIRELRDNGLTLREIAFMFRLHRATIGNALNGRGTYGR